MVDGREPFQLEVLGAFSKFLVLEVPRPILVARHPHLQDMTSIALDLERENTLLLRTLLLHIFEAVPRLDLVSRTTLFPTVLQLIGTQAVADRHFASQSERRCRMALARIEAELGNPVLTAPVIAEALHISRRRLDLLVKRKLGVSVAERIRQRRLEQAAEDLQDSAQSARSVTHIAFSLGFESLAHFTRAFRKRYRCTPGQWRQVGRAITPVGC